MGMCVTLSARVMELDWPGTRTKDMAQRLDELGWDHRVSICSLLNDTTTHDDYHSHAPIFFDSDDAVPEQYRGEWRFPHSRGMSTSASISCRPLTLTLSPS